MTYDFDGRTNRRRSDSLKWNQYDDDVLPMWVADMDFRAPDPVIRAMHERVDHGVFGYGWVPPDLGEVIVERLQRLYDWQVSPQELVFLPGAVTSFNLVCHAMGAPGDGVLMQTPIYFPMLWAPSGAGLTNDEMELTRVPDGSYAIEFGLFERAITDRTRIFMLCNPHNPIGRVFRREELEQMAEICLRHDILICSDEIHCDLVFQGSRHVPIATLAPEVADRTITLMAPSKTFNLPGLKCSVAIVQNAELRKKLQDTHMGLVHGVNVMGVAAAVAAYREGQPWLDELLRYLEANLDLLVEYAGAHLPGISMSRPEATYLAWLSCHEAGIPGKPDEFFLNEARVAFNDGAIFGRGGEGFVRLNFGCRRSMLAEALDRMKNALLTLTHD